MFDCCMVNSEMDLLDIRFNTLDSVVEKFVVVESARTHSGKPKRLWFDENKAQFEKFLPKIIHLIFEGVAIDNPQEDTHLVWWNETEQRNTVLKALDIATPHDGLIFVSDADEIPKPEKLLDAKELHYASGGLPVRLGLEQCLYFLNYHYAEMPQICGSLLYNPSTAQEIHARWGQADYSPTRLRWHSVAPGCENDFPTVWNAGWHFSTLGSVDEIKYKLESNAHRFCDTDEFKDTNRLNQCITEGTHLYDMARYEECRLVRVESPAFLPQYVRDNPDKFRKHLI